MRSRFPGSLVLAAMFFFNLIPVAHAADPVTLTLWHNHPEWKGRVVAIFQKFENEHPGIHIELQEIPDSAYVPRLNTALAAGEAPDIIALDAGPDMRAAAAAGYTTDLTSRLDVTSLTPSGLSASKVDGRIYGVPIMGAYTVGLYYNRDIFAKQGLTPPKTWDDFITVANLLQPGSGYGTTARDWAAWNTALAASNITVS